MLMENQSDHNYTTITFVKAVDRGKLINASKATLLIVQHLERAFQVIVVQEKQLHKNVEYDVIECARKSIQLKNHSLFFHDSHPINVELGSPSHEYVLFKLICKTFIKIRMRHYQREYNLREVFNNNSTLRKKLSKIILFKNL